MGSMAQSPAQHERHVAPVCVLSVLSVGVGTWLLSGHFDFGESCREGAQMWGWHLYMLESSILSRVTVVIGILPHFLWRPPLPHTRALFKKSLWPVVPPPVGT